MSGPERCGATTYVPTEVTGAAKITQSTGYPDGCVARCRRALDHDGEHWTALPLASSPGSFSWRWTSPASSPMGQHP